jgi:hypothetical protein
MTTQNHEDGDLNSQLPIRRLRARNSMYRRRTMSAAWRLATFHRGYSGPGLFSQEASAAIPLSSEYSSSVNRKDAACTFSSRWATEEVPGMGSIIGDRFSNHANAT